MIFSSVVVSVLAILFTQNEAYSSKRKVLEPEIKKFSSDKWNNKGAAKGTNIITPVFMINRDSSAVARFEKQLLDISNPSSPNYGKWLTKDQINAQIAPSAADVKFVTDYLATFNIPSKDIKVSDYGDKVFVKMSVNTAAQIFQTSFATFTSTVRQSVSLIRATGPYSLPDDVASVVALVDDLVRLPNVQSTLTVPESQASQMKEAAAFGTCGSCPSSYISPSVLQQAYKYTPLTGASAAGNGVAVAEFQSQYYDSTNMNNFNAQCGQSISVATTIGGNTPSVCATANQCVESLLDIEYLGAVTGSIPMTFIYYDSFSLITWIDGVNTMANPPLVHSVSYGNDEVQQTSVAYMQQCNTQFMISGTLGLSILFAAGDQGVWGRTGPCTGIGCTFHPDFPASSPYITAVGATDFKTASTVGPETAWTCGGGGFSNTFGIPSYQASQVKNYLAAATTAGVLPTASLFNASGRAYPDLSAVGGGVNPYCVFASGGAGGVYGTSASCPVVAGIFGLLNNVRLSAGLPSLGFLNPLIYANPQCFNDVNDGSLNNCNAGYTGFASLSGWDPATGNGTPNYSCLANVIAGPRKPTLKPTAPPTFQPTLKPTLKPSSKPTLTPTFKPTSKPTATPTAIPISTIKPSAVPLTTQIPSAKPSSKPTKPTLAPQVPNSGRPTGHPSTKPTLVPS